MGCLLVTALYNFFYRSAADHPINWESPKDGKKPVTDKSVYRALGAAV
jgi:hypothetical protein